MDAGTGTGTDGGFDGEFDFHHVGVATRDAAALAALYGDLLGAPAVHEERVDGLSVVFLDVGGGYVELLEPVGRAGDDGGGDGEDDGPVAKFLDRRGPGIHHLALATDDLEGALAAARAAGVDLVDETPRPGAWGHRVAFLHPGSTGGVLLEFVGAGGHDGDDPPPE